MDFYNIIFSAAEGKKAGSFITTEEGRVVFVGGPGSGGGGSGSAASPKQLQVANFWEAVVEKYGDDGTGRITQKISALREGKADWFRDASLINVVAANNSRIGRIGFDQEKYERIIDDIVSIGKELDVDVGGLQR